jgi:hypothetical protein
MIWQQEKQIMGTRHLEYLYGVDKAFNPIQGQQNNIQTHLQKTIAAGSMNI